MLRCMNQRSDIPQTGGISKNDRSQQFPSKIVAKLTLFDTHQQFLINSLSLIVKYPYTYESSNQEYWVIGCLSSDHMACWKTTQLQFVDVPSYKPPFRSGFFNQARLITAGYQQGDYFPSIYIYTHYIIISPFVLVKSSMFEGRKTLPDVQHPIEGPEGHRATMSCCSRLFAVFLKEHSATSERWKVPQGKHQEIPLWGHHVKHSNCLNPYK